MKTSAPVSTLRYHSGASWAARIQHLTWGRFRRQCTVLEAFRRLALFSLPPDHFATHDDVGEAVVVHARDAADVEEDALHHSSLNALTVSPEEDLEVCEHMVVRSGPRRGVGIEAPQQHSAVGFPQLVEVAGRESPGHTAVEHDLEYFRLQGTDLVCHCDVWVVVHRPAVLEEAVPGVASTAFDLRANVPNAADGAAKIHEGVDLAVPFRCSCSFLFGVPLWRLIM